MPDVNGYTLPGHEETYMYADAKVRSYGYGNALPTVTGSTDSEFLANIESLCAEKVKMSTFQAILYPPGTAFDGNSFIAQIWSNIDGSGNKYIKVKAHGVTTTSEFQRVCYGNTWSEPEWENPPMLLGVEYRTTKRHNGKAVYTKAIRYSIAEATASTGCTDITIPHGVSNLNELVSHTGNITNKWLLPYLSSTGGHVNINMIESAQVTVRFYNSGFGVGEFINLVLEYTKN